MYARLGGIGAGRLLPVALEAFFGVGFHHPDLRGATVGDWPLNVFSDTDAATELPTNARSHSGSKILKLTKYLT